MVCGQAGPPVPGVRWFEKLSTEELADLYRRAWIFCLPSTYEGFGIPYIEAMASGTPVLATENEGAIALLADRQAGWTVRDADLGETLVELLDAPDTRAKLGRAGRTFGMSFSWDVVLPAFEREYRSLLARRSTRRGTRVRPM
jgi:glycosyltransferase involved in cell wall biosynthesis